MIRYSLHAKVLLLGSVLFLTSCKKEATQISTTDSTTVALGHDTLPGSTSTVTHDTVYLPSKGDSVQKPGDDKPSTDKPGTETGQRLLPVDEASQDASFAQFRQQMIAAVDAKNGEALMGMLDPKIRLSFGGSGGLADFKKNWKPQDKNSPLWTKLGWVLKHGGSFRNEGTNKMFWAPYVYSKWPDSGPDAFEYGAIVGSAVPVFEKADASSAQIATLDHHFVKVLDGGHLREKTPEFVKIQTPSGKTGFVRSSEVRSQLDYRAGFDKRSGSWKMTTFIAGD